MTRRKIYKAILENPGIHQRELVRKTNIAYGTLRYHTRRLIKHGMITKKYEKGYMRYFVSNKIDKKDKEILNLLRQDIPRKILMLLLVQKSYYSLTKEQIRNTGNTKFWEKNTDFERYKIKLNLTTINYHLKKLIDVGVVERIREGRKISYRIADEDKIIDLIIRYQESLDDSIVNDVIDWFSSKLFGNRTKLYMDMTMKRIYEVFPHPYHV